MSIVAPKAFDKADLKGTILNLSKGDTLYAVEAQDGSFRLTPFDPEFEARLKKADDIMRRYRNTLRVLAQ